MLLGRWGLCASRKTDVALSGLAEVNGSAKKRRNLLLFVKAAGGSERVCKRQQAGISGIETSQRDQPRDALLFPGTGISSTRQQQAEY